MKRLELQLHDAERSEIVRRAKAAGLCAATFCRFAALGYPMPAKRFDIEAEAVAALNRVGNNLNQIAKAANKSGRLDAAHERQLSHAVAQVSEAVATIREGASA
ncbi:plasmid mobilization protein [Mangrovicoccus algicola]|uniref:Plasmid mobilization relaxosome protein MobC n=1 Tax=Mangrovicoccus algicola TaxID=2771008 RepID=A0A8J7CJ31_9RHOB|nr:plasmid mobilization relaxosome protein MobC [Mangrovicoccus algicola]MBE3637216.1 plasmid mobilization relaxosome protein MobC [Mangrovicoccus algicola]